MKKYKVIPLTHELQSNGSIIKKGSKTLAEEHGYKSRKEMKLALGLPAFIAAEDAYFSSIYTQSIADFRKLIDAKKFAAENDAQVAYRFRNSIKHIQ